MSFENKNNKEKGKYVPLAGSPEAIETGWSPWQWDQRGYSTSFRTNSAGVLEWAYKYPDQQERSPQDIPRSLTYPQQDLSQYRGTSYGSDTGGNYLDAQAKTFTPTHQTGFTSNIENVSWAKRPDASSLINTQHNTWNQYPVSHTVPSHHSFPALPPSDSANAPTQNITRGMQHLSVNSQWSAPFPQGGYPEVSQGPSGMAPGYSTSNQEVSAKTTPLDPRYHVIPPNKSKEFWRVGRVFKMVWSEPAGEKSIAKGATTHSNVSDTIYGAKAFNEIRRFVIVDDCWGFCLCIAIHTYSGQATLKPGLPDPQNHAIIYTSKHPPSPHYTTDSKGNVIAREQLIIDEIKVISEGNVREQLDPKSRIHFRKVYTVEKNSKVLNVGLVAEASMWILKTHSPVKMSENPTPTRLSVNQQRGKPRRDSDFREVGATRGESSASAAVLVAQTSSNRTSYKKYDQPGPSTRREDSHAGQHHSSRQRRNSEAQQSSSHRQNRSPPPDPSSKPESKHRHHKKK